MVNGPRWLALVLLASLGGNVFLGGYLVGHWTAPFGQGPFGPPQFGPPPFGPPPFGPAGGPPGGPPGGRPPPPGSRGFVDHLTRWLSPEDAAAVQRVFASEQPFFDEAERNHREFPRRLREALLVEPFDAAAFEKTLADHDTAEFKFHERMRVLLAKAAVALSPDGRRRLAEMGPK